MPAARQRSRSSSSACAVRAMTGVWLPRSFSMARNAASAQESVHRRHLNVQQHQVEPVLLERTHAQMPVGGDDHVEAAPIEQGGRHLLVDHVVLDEEHAALDLARLCRHRRRIRRLRRFGDSVAVRRASRPCEVPETHGRRRRRPDAENGVLVARDGRVRGPSDDQRGRNRQTRAFRVPQERHRRPRADARAQHRQVVSVSPRQLRHQLLSRAGERDDRALPDKRGGERLSCAGMIRRHQHPQQGAGPRRGRCTSRPRRPQESPE